MRVERHNRCLSTVAIIIWSILLGHVLWELVRTSLPLFDIPASDIVPVFLMPIAMIALSALLRTQRIGASIPAVAVAGQLVIIFLGGIYVLSALMPNDIG